MSDADKLAVVIADSLNELAGYIACGEDVPRHTPRSPGFWFYSLAREQRALCRSRRFRAMLTREARAALNARPSAWARALTTKQGGVWVATSSRVGH